MVVSADAEKQMGHDPYLVVVDELGSHTDDRLYVSLRSSLIKDPSARMRVISTMGGHEDAPMPTMRRRALEDGKVTRRGRSCGPRPPTSSGWSGRLPRVPTLTTCAK